MVLDFNFYIKDFDGKDIQDAQAGKLLANALSFLNKGNSIKLYDWALSIWKGKTLEIDSTDCEMLCAIIESSENLTVLSKAQILNYIKSMTNKK